MGRLRYEKSVSYRGHLIIPLLFSQIADQPLYSYRLLSDTGHAGPFHKAENPAGLYSGTIDDIIQVAREHLDRSLAAASAIDHFRCRYTYCHNLIIVYQIDCKCFYDHYPPESLNNIAAPKLFRSEYECIAWVKQGIDRNTRKQAFRPAELRPFQPD